MSSDYSYGHISKNFINEAKNLKELENAANALVNQLQSTNTPADAKVLQQILTLTKGFVRKSDYNSNKKTIENILTVVKSLSDKKDKPIQKIIKSFEVFLTGKGRVDTQEITISKTHSKCYQVSEKILEQKTKAKVDIDNEHAKKSVSTNRKSMEY